MMFGQATFAQPRFASITPIPDGEIVWQDVCKPDNLFEGCLPENAIRQIPCQKTEES